MTYRNIEIYRVTEWSGAWFYMVTGLDQEFLTVDEAMAAIDGLCGDYDAREISV